MTGRHANPWSIAVMTVAGILIASLIGLPSRASAQAEEAAGAAATQPTESLRAVVIQVQGRVRTRSGPDAEWQTLKENDVIRGGAEVQTGLRATATLRLGSNATVLLDGTTSVIIPMLERDGSSLSTRVLVRNGRADIRVDRVGLDNDFKVLTPSTTIAVSGTTLAVVNGKLMGTEVTGARSNLIAAIEARWVARRLAFYFGEGTSTRRFPDPAVHGINKTVERNLLPGVVDDAAQLQQAWVNGSLQNVQFNINSLQRALNLQPPVVDEELASLGVLQQLLDLRERTAQEAATAGGAALLAQAFSQKAIALAAAAQAMLPDIELVIDQQTVNASYAAGAASAANIVAHNYAAIAATSKDDAIKALDGTVIAVKNQDFQLAQQFADAAALAAIFALDAAMGASYASKDAFIAAQSAASAAAVAQNAIDGYFNKVAGAEACASQAAAQATIASNAAAAAKSLNALSQQLGAAAQDGNFSPILAQINVNTNVAISASIAAAQARDQALQAASTARTMGEMTLFNSAAVYASQAAADAASAAAASNQALQDAMIAQEAAELAQKLARSKPGGGGN